jgi:hypothetical protein
MREADDIGTLAGVRARVQQACEWLLAPTPAVLDRCAAALSAAISELRGCRSQIEDDKASPRLREEARRLKAALRRVGALLQSAADYHAGWRRTLGALCAGYTASGAAADAAPPGRLCLRG